MKRKFICIFTVFLLVCCGVTVPASAQEEKVLLGGEAVGVAMFTKGLLVTDTAAVEGKNGWENPAREAGLKPGDYLIACNGTPLSDVAGLEARVQACRGKSLQLDVQRGTETLKITLTPVNCDGVWCVGLWLRESTAGIGTLTFIDPGSGRFYALGHAIADADTGTVLTVGNGRIVACSVTGVVRGEKNAPGELQGSFSALSGILGTVEKNEAFGLRGKAAAELLAGRESVRIGARKNVHEGAAEIVATVDGTGPHRYQVEIVSVQEQAQPAPKSMVLHVTDEALIAKTGGIVQGMSGSPILQDGRLIGAVTHVMVGDPTRGYGIFLEWMR